MFNRSEIVSVCSYVCVNCEISVKSFQRLLNNVIYKKNNLSFDVNVKMRQVVYMELFTGIV